MFFLFLWNENLPKVLCSVKQVTEPERERERKGEKGRERERRRCLKSFPRPRGKFSSLSLSLSYPLGIKQRIIRPLFISSVCSCEPASGIIGFRPFSTFSPPALASSKLSSELGRVNPSIRSSPRQLATRQLNKRLFYVFFFFFFLEKKKVEQGSPTLKSINFVLFSREER